MPVSPASETPLFLWGEGETARNEREGGVVVHVSADARLVEHNQTVSGRKRDQQHPVSVGLRSCALQRDGVQGECFTRLRAPFQGATNTLEQLAALSKLGTEGRFLLFYPGIGVHTMPTDSPSKVHLSSSSAKARQMPKPELKDFDSSWLEMGDLDALIFRVEQLRALANAMYCVAYIDEDPRVREYLNHGRYSDHPHAVETLAPLSLLSQRLCDEVDYHIHALNHARTEDKCQRLDPEERSLLDEVADILLQASPAKKAVFALKIREFQQARQKNASHTSPKQGKNERNGQGKG